MTSPIDELRSQIMAILRSEAADGELLCADHGVRDVPVASWSASIWKPAGQMLEIVGVQMGDGSCRLTAATVTTSSRFTIDVPSEAVEPGIRQLIAALRA